MMWKSSTMEAPHNKFTNQLLHAHNIKNVLSEGSKIHKAREIR